MEPKRYDADSCSPSAVPRRRRTERPRVRRQAASDRRDFVGRQSASHHEPSVQPGARPPSGGWIDSGFKPLLAISHEITELEFHISPVANSSGPKPASGGRAPVKQSPCTLCVIRQPPRTIDGLADIRDDTIAPATHLVAQDPKAPCPVRANRATSGHATPRSVTARDGRLFNHEAPLRHAHLKRGMVEITCRPMLEPRHHRFEHATIETHGMAARPQRQPVQIDASNGLTAAGTRLLNVVSRHPSKGSHDRTGSILSADVLRISLGQRLAVCAKRGSEAKVAIVGRQDAATRRRASSLVATVASPCRGAAR